MYLNSRNITLGCILCVTLMATVFQIVASQKRYVIPPGMDESRFPDPSWDADAPSCEPEREPCGFYTFPVGSRSSMKWVKSWCKCGPGHFCRYDKTDSKMRVYRQVCQPLSDAYRFEDGFRQGF
uniref:Secreted protein n=1 Tax=Parastrongyloides trichosuri TaxID=131310 RepID=A0A0N4Z2C2_PARTI